MHLKQTHVRVVGHSDFGLEILYLSPTGKRHLHVGLPGAEPYLARKDIVDSQDITVIKYDAERAAGRRSGKRHSEVALRVGSGLDSFAP
jgi:hypothetical protein